jgi:hypothetical protein
MSLQLPVPLQLQLSLLLSVLAVILSASGSPASLLAGVKAKDPDALNIATTVRPFQPPEFRRNSLHPATNLKKQPKNPCQAPFMPIPLPIKQIPLAY